MTSDREKLKALAEAATKGEWRYGPGDGEDENPIVFVDLPNASGVAISILFEADWATDADAAFVAKASPQVVLALLEEIEHLTESRREAREARNRIGDRHDAIETERDQLKAENEQLRGVMAAVVSEIPYGKHIQPGNSPGHSHRVPGVWGEDNGAKAGKECGWCKVWNAALAMTKEASHG